MFHLLAVETFMLPSCYTAIARKSANNVLSFKKEIPATWNTELPFPFKATEEYSWNYLHHMPCLPKRHRLLFVKCELTLFIECDIQELTSVAWVEHRTAPCYFLCKTGSIADLYNRYVCPVLRNWIFYIGFHSSQEMLLPAGCRNLSHNYWYVGSYINTLPIWTSSHHYGK